MRNRAAIGAVACGLAAGGCAAYLVTFIITPKPAALVPVTTAQLAGTVLQVDLDRHEILIDTVSPYYNREHAALRIGYSAQTKFVINTGPDSQTDGGPGDLVQGGEIRFSISRAPGSLSATYVAMK